MKKCKRKTKFFPGLNSTYCSARIELLSTKIEIEIPEQIGKKIGRIKVLKSECCTKTKTF